MFKVQWYKPNGLYEANGGASANSLFFETKDDHALFLQYWNRFMSSYAELIHYSLTEVSWSLIFKTKSEAEILKTYNYKFEASKKVKQTCKLSDSGRILSQAMRLFLSNYVATSNRFLGKKGSRVSRRFHKYGFIDVTDYKVRIDVLERMQQLHQQKKLKYRPVERYKLMRFPKYDEKNELGFACRFRSAKPYYLGELKEHFCVSNFTCLNKNSTVLRSKIKSTFLAHFPPKPPD